MQDVRCRTDELHCGGLHCRRAPNGNKCSSEWKRASLRRSCITSEILHISTPVVSRRQLAEVTDGLIAAQCAIYPSTARRLCCHSAHVQ